MKVLSTEQQEALLSLLEGVNSDDLEIQYQIVYWRIELKPKRIRKKNPDVQDNLLYKPVDIDVTV